MLALTVDAAWDFFSDEAAVCRALKVLREVGLGYLRLGQPATELSGGEAQRIKLATELQRAQRGDTLYVLDEPTTGLHPADVEKLMAQLDGLVESGNTVIVVEHDMRVVAGSDWVIDIGPGAGDEGGRIVAEGPPAEVARNPRAARRRISRGFSASNAARAQPHGEARRGLDGRGVPDPRQGLFRHRTIQAAQEDRRVHRRADHQRGGRTPRSSARAAHQRARQPLEHRRLGRRQRHALHQPLVPANSFLQTFGRRLLVLALRDIRPGEEITVDYVSSMHSDRKRCTCGATNCRGTINKQ